MKGRRKLQIRCALVLILALLLAGCQSKESDEKKEEDTKKEKVSEENEVSEGAKAVIEAMMTAPNQDLLFTPTILGEGTTEDGETTGKTQASNDIVKERWEEKAGAYFAEGKLEDFLASGSAMTYLQAAEDEGVKIQVNEMTLKKRSENTEQVLVSYEKGDQEAETVWTFSMDSDGKITGVAENGRRSGDTEVREYEQKEITREEFLSLYEKKVNLTGEEAKKKLEEEHESLRIYGIRAEEYDIVYEERTKDKDVGDGLILTAAIYTEMLVNKETGKYEYYGIAAPVEVSLGGDTEGLGECNISFDTITDQNGLVHVVMNGQAMFQTDGTREFTKVDIQESDKNCYRYSITEEIVFTL